MNISPNIKHIWKKTPAFPEYKWFWLSAVHHTFENNENEEGYHSELIIIKQDCIAQQFWSNSLSF